MWLQQITPPAETPVTLAEVKAHLRVLNTSSDDYITSLILAATQYLEGRHGILGRSLVTQTWQTRLDRFPWRSGARIELPLPPLQSVAWVKYVDLNGTETTLAPELYQVDAQHMVGRIRPAYGTQWPATLDDEGAVRIQFVAGYGAPAAVPETIKQAIKLLVGHWHINRETVGQVGTGPIAYAVDALVLPHRMVAP